MFRKYASSRRRTSSAGNIDVPQESLFRIYRNSRFFVSIMLVTSSLILGVIPKLMYVFMLIADNKVPLPFKYYVEFCRLLSDMVDGIIYVMLQPSVRKLLLEKLSSALRHCTSITNDNARQENSTVVNTTIMNVSEMQRHTQDVQITTQL